MIVAVIEYSIQAIRLHGDQQIIHWINDGDGICTVSFEVAEGDELAWQINLIPVECTRF